jgi:hypothetical protein
MVMSIPIPLFPTIAFPAIAWWPRDQDEDLESWRRRIRLWCDDNGISNRKELLRGQGLTVWGSDRQITKFKLFFR